MKLFFYNDRLNDSSCHGSFTVCSRMLNEAAKRLGVYAEDNRADHILFIDALNVSAKFNNKLLIPILVSEYNFCYRGLIEPLKQHPITFAISEQAKNSFVNSGADANKIHVVHLGSDSQKWQNLNKDRKNISVFTYLTVNSSNNRSGFELLIPAFIEWSKGKNVRLIIKDQQNNHLAALIQEIDKEKKIAYIGENINDNQLNQLYCNSHIHIYANSVTSFGLNILDASLAGLPQIVSRSSAIPEFTSDDFVTYVDTFEQPVDALLLAEYSAFGLVNNLLPLEQYCGKLVTTRPKYRSIIEKLEYSYRNYLELVTKNEDFSRYIKSNLTWERSVKKIIEVLK